MSYKTILICIYLSLAYCSSTGTEAKSNLLLTNQVAIPIEKARELKSLYCKTHLVGKEENFKNVAEVVDSYYVFPGSFYIFKSSAIKHGIWVNMYNGIVYNGKANVKKSNGWNPQRKDLEE
jgi:hypothetical protein